MAPDYFDGLLAALARRLSWSGAVNALLDGTTARRGCVVLMASIVYRQCAIPLLWSVVKGKPVFGPSSMRCGKVGVFPSAS
jgi:hypothetical protein